MNATTMAVDLAKNVFQLAYADAHCAVTAEAVLSHYITLSHVCEHPGVEFLVVAVFPPQARLEGESNLDSMKARRLAEGISAIDIARNVRNSSTCI